MKFIPLNLHLEIKPIEQEGIIATQSSSYEEKGLVLSVAEGVTLAKPGDIIFFDAWLCAKFPTGEQDKFGNDLFHWLVQEKDIRAKETDG